MIDRKAIEEEIGRCVKEERPIEQWKQVMHRVLDPYQRTKTQHELLMSSKEPGMMSTAGEPVLTEEATDVIKLFVGRVEQIVGLVSTDSDEADLLDLIDVLCYLMSFEVNGECSLTAKLLSDESSIIDSLLTLLREEMHKDKTLFRIEMIDFLKTVALTNSKKNLTPLRKKLISIPLSLQVLVSLLDDSREEVRYSLLTLLKALTEKGPEISREDSAVLGMSQPVPGEMEGDNELENFFAFSEGFHKLMNIIKTEINLDSMVFDCLKIIYNVVYNNKTSLKLFLSNRSFLEDLYAVLAFPILRIEADAGVQVSFIDIDSVSEVRKQNVLLILDIIHVVFYNAEQKFNSLCLEHPLFHDVYHTYDYGPLWKLQGRRELIVSLENDLSSVFDLRSLEQLLERLKQLYLQIPVDDHELEDSRVVDVTFSSIRMKVLQVICNIITFYRLEKNSFLVSRFLEKKLSVPSNSHLYEFATQAHTSIGTFPGDQHSEEEEEETDRVFAIDFLASLLLVYMFSVEDSKEKHLCYFILSSVFLAQTMKRTSDYELATLVDGHCQFLVFSREEKGSQLLQNPHASGPIEELTCVETLLHSTLLSTKDVLDLAEAQNPDLDALVSSVQVLYYVNTILHWACFENRDVKHILYHKMLAMKQPGSSGSAHGFYTEFLTLLARALEVIQSRSQSRRSATATEQKVLLALELATVFQVAFFAELLSDNLLLVEKLLNHVVLVQMTELLKKGALLSPITHTSRCLQGVLALVHGEVLQVLFKAGENDHLNRFLKVVMQVLGRVTFFNALEALDTLDAFEVCGTSKKILRRERVAFHLTAQGLFVQDGNGRWAVSNRLALFPKTFYLKYKKRIQDSRTLVVDQLLSNLGTSTNTESLAKGSIPLEAQSKEPLDALKLRTENEALKKEILRLTNIVNRIEVDGGEASDTQATGARDDLVFFSNYKHFCRDKFQMNVCEKVLFLDVHLNLIRSILELTDEPKKEAVVFAAQLLAYFIDALAAQGTTAWKAKERIHELVIEVLELAVRSQVAEAGVQLFNALKGAELRLEPELSDRLRSVGALLEKLKARAERVKQDDQLASLRWEAISAIYEEAILERGGVAALESVKACAKELRLT